MNITTTSPRLTKPSRRRIGYRRTTSKPVESQVLTTPSPKTPTNRFRFVSRKPYLKNSTQQTITESSDQTLEPTNHQSSEEISKNKNETDELGNIALALQKIQKAPIPQDKPPRKLPQTFRLTSQTATRLTTIEPSTSTATSETYYTRYSTNPQRKPSKSTIAIKIPFLRGNYATPETPMTEKFLLEDVVTGPPLIRGVYSSPQTITAEEYINKYTQPAVTSTRAKYRYSTTSTPRVTINPDIQLVVKSTRSQTRTQPQAFEKVLTPANTHSSIQDYDYYDNLEASILGQIPTHTKVLLHSNGVIECLDQGNFPHPISCKMFIYCAKMDNDKILGWEYTCPKNLSFDPIGGMCNWSAGLGCNES